MARQLVTDYLENFRSLGEAPAYVYQRGYRTARWTYLEVAQTAAQFARELERRGVTKGERVVLGGANTAEWVAAFFGCLLRGAVAVPMDRIAAPEFVRRVAEQVDAKLIVASRELLAVWTQASAGESPASTRSAATPSIALESLRDEVAHHSSERYEAQGISRGDAVEIVFTSGATADPKGVVITHANILANLAPFEPEIARYRKYERLFHPIRFLNLLPLSHVFGQFLGIFIPQLTGGTVLFEETLNPGELISTVKRERVSVIVTVPRLLQSLREKLLRDAEASGSGAQLHRNFLRNLEAAKDEKFLWRWWRFRRVHRQFGWKFWAFISGGAALDAETEEFWRRLGYVVVQGYGLTETTSLISVEHPFRKGPRSIGKVLPGREMKLDPTTGEILVRGESVAGQYWQGRELKPVAGEEGWFPTGDLGEVDAGGNLQFKGRRKNVIVNPAGLNIYPEDLEAALKRDPAVRDAVVVPLPIEASSARPARPGAAGPTR